MLQIRHCLACALLCISGGSGAQVASAPAKTVQFSKLILNPDIPKTSQHVKVGTICLFAGPPVDFGTSERTINYERFERLFATVVKKSGFSVLAKSSNLFEGEGSGASANFLVGATLQPQSVDICDSVDGQKGTVTVSIEWQIYDRSKQQVVETVTTPGSGQFLKFEREGLTQMIDNAFSSSLAKLIEQGALQKYLGNPKL